MENKNNLTTIYQLRKLKYLKKQVEHGQTLEPCFLKCFETNLYEINKELKKQLPEVVLCHTKFKTFEAKEEDLNVDTTGLPWRHPLNHPTCFPTYEIIYYLEAPNTPKIPIASKSIIQDYGCDIEEIIAFKDYAMSDATLQKLKLNLLNTSTVDILRKPTGYEEIDTNYFRQKRIKVSNLYIYQKYNSFSLQKQHPATKEISGLNEVLWKVVENKISEREAQQTKEIVTHFKQKQTQLENYCDVNKNKELSSTLL